MHGFPIDEKDEDKDEDAPKDGEAPADGQGGEGPPDERIIEIPEELPDEVVLGDEGSDARGGSTRSPAPEELVGPRPIVREVVLPGDVLDAGGSRRAGPGTFKEGGRILASVVGVRSDRGDQVAVAALSGRYIPVAGDEVIGRVIDLGPSNWVVDVAGPSPAPLHVNDTPWRVDFGDTASYLGIGETVLVQVSSVDETRKVMVSMARPGLKKLTGGRVISVASSKVPRIVGRDGSMITMLRHYTNTQSIVGQNGLIWVEGAPADVDLFMEAVRRIEDRAHHFGLTEDMAAWLQQATGKPAIPLQPEGHDVAYPSAPPAQQMPMGGGGGRDRGRGGGRDRRGPPRFGGDDRRGDRGPPRGGPPGDRRDGFRGPPRGGPPGDRRDGFRGPPREGPPGERRDDDGGEDDDRRSDGRRDDPRRRRRRGGGRPPGGYRAAVAGKQDSNGGGSGGGGEGDGGSGQARKNDDGDAGYNPHD